MATRFHAWRVLRDLARTLYTQRKWWLVPLVVLSLLLVLLVAAQGTPLAPFLYTVF